MRRACCTSSAADWQIALVRDLPDLLRPGDLLVVNDTRVIPARLRGRSGAGGIEVTLHKRVDGGTWLAFARPGKKLKPGSVIDFPDGLMAEAIEKHEGGEVALRFNRAGDALLAALEQHGEMPLPPYIKRAHGEASDRSDYQTMFARAAGAVAAPTAGLHFTPDLLARLEARGIRRAQVTLHVGAGTFLPVKVDDTDDHRMHSEWGEHPAGDRRGHRTQRAPTAGASSRSARPRCACWKVRRARTAASAPFAARPTSSSRPAIASRRSTCC